MEQLRILGCPSFKQTNPHHPTSTSKCTVLGPNWTQWLTWKVSATRMPMVQPRSRAFPLPCVDLLLKGGSVSKVVHFCGPDLTSPLGVGMFGSIWLPMGQKKGSFYLLNHPFWCPNNLIYNFFNCHRGKLKTMPVNSDNIQAESAERNPARCGQLLLLS